MVVVVVVVWCYMHMLVVHVATVLLPLPHQVEPTNKPISADFVTAMVEGGTNPSPKPSLALALALALAPAPALALALALALAPNLTRSHRALRSAT